MIRMHTSFGVIELELFPQQAPDTVANFVEYVNAGYYDGTIFHRVIPGFMIQGGGFGPGLTPKQEGDPIKNEANNGLKNVEGSIAMARTQDPHSATAQFFINTADNDFLDFTAETDEGWGYTVFGKVTSGLTTAHQISLVETGSQGGHDDVPVEEITIEKIEIIP